MKFIALCNAAMLAFLGFAAHAQSPATAKSDAPKQPSRPSMFAISNEPAASPEALALARKLVDETGTGKARAMEGLSLPIARIIKSLGVPPQHGGDVMRAVIMPVMFDHGDELTAIQTNSYASNLSLDDLKASVAFYATPAGKDLAQARSRIMNFNMTAVTALFEKLMPEFRKRTDEVMKEQGWSKTAPAADPPPGPRPVSPGH
jgi:hypothetical protein